MEATKGRKTELRLDGKPASYAAVDAARFVCALLVVAIHVRPLETYTELGSFLLDKGICRIAVPFFFLVSGYFYGRKPMTVRSLGAFLWRIALLYALWTAIYYPIVAESQDMNHYWRRCLLSGSYYHLWYYPAMFAAAVLTFLCWKIFASGRPVVAIAFACYFVGCMGESYYGLFAQSPGITALAEWYFSLFWSTRSGLFFGFFFFALGVFLQRQSWRMSRNRAAIALAVSVVLMFVEILTLRRLGIAKDYNLYFALVPASAFLFLWLTAAPVVAGGMSGRTDATGDGGERRKNGGGEANGKAGGTGTAALASAESSASPAIGLFLRRSSVLIYGIHLWFKYYGQKYAVGIAAGTVFPDAGEGLRQMAELFLANSMAQYLMICALSFLFAAAVLALQRIPFLRFLKYLY